MSRIGKKPIVVKSGIDVSIENGEIMVKGSKGQLKRKIPGGLEVKLENNTVQVSLGTAPPSMYGLYRTLIANMVAGVDTGFEKDLELKGVGYRAQVQGKILNLQLGFSHPVEFKLPEGIEAKVDANTKIKISGMDKEVVGQTAASIRSLRPPEPYKGKGVRYLGEKVTLKQGKTAGGK